MPKVLRLHAYTGVSGLSLDDVLLPKPAKGEVLIDVAAFALNWGDMDLMEDNYSFSFEELPARIGSEAVGIVRAVGPSVSSQLIGKRVSTIPHFYRDKGVNGEFAVVPEMYITDAPDNLSDVRACSVWMQYLTAYFPLVEFVELDSRSIVLITAATGSAGLAALEIAKILGVTTICTTRSEGNRSVLTKSGADHVIVTSTEDLADRLNELTGDAGVNLIYDPIGGKVMSAYAQALAQDAVIVLYGGLSKEQTVLPELEMTTKNAVLRPYSVMNYSANDDMRRRGIAFIYGALQRGVLNATVDRTFPLESYDAAFTYMKSSRTSHGKIVVTTTPVK